MIIRERGMLRQTIYSAIKVLIVTGQLPPGGRILEIDLADQLKVSRTPIREALNRLERDGLVVVRPRSGFAVAPLDEQSARDAFDLREALEVHAATLAAANIDDAGRAHLREIINECEVLGALPERTMQEGLIETQLGVDLHRVIARLSGNAMLAEALDRVLDRCQAWVWMDLNGFDGWNETRAEHRRIIEAICRQDGAAAVLEVRAHIRDARANVLRLVDARRELFTLSASGTELDRIFS